MTTFRYIWTVLFVLLALGPVVIVTACLLFRAGRTRRGGDGPARLPGRGDAVDRDGE